MPRKTVSAIMFTLLIISMLTLASNIQPVKASGTIYIRADGSIDPPTAPIYTVDNITYTLTGNITADADGIVIERDNIVVDGAGYTIQGTGVSTGIALAGGRNNVTIENMSIMQFSTCIALWGCSDITLSGNNVTGNIPSGFGISVFGSSNSSIVGNDLEDNGVGIFMYVYSTNNFIYANNISQNGWGIWSVYDSNITIANNDFTANSGGAIWMNTSSYCTISGNDVLDNYQGIGLGDSFNDVVSENKVTGTDLSGIALYESYDNAVYGNIINGNGVGIRTDIYSSNNKLYHNDMVDNAQQADTYASPNDWDNGYPSGGNYWSDYNGTDLYSGPYQNETGSDGIGDTPYVIDSSNQDNYPLMNPWVAFENQAIYIRANGSVDPQSAPILRNGDTYTLVANLYDDPIFIYRDNIVLDGNGYTLQGPGDPSTIPGISLIGVSGVTIKSTNISGFQTGIYCGGTSNIVSENNIACNEMGIYVDGNYNNIVENIISNHTEGLFIYGSSYNNILRNKIKYNSDAIVLRFSPFNNLADNDITSNCRPIADYYSSQNKIYHNNFTSNYEVGIADATDVWDDGYPSGGNYWSDYTGLDQKCGPSQDHPGSDGIGDTPYVIDNNNTDNYPLMNPWTQPAGHNIAVISVVSSKIVICQGFSGNITVYGANKGVYPETFNITVYANTTEIASMVSPLENDSITNITLSWNTTGSALGNYTISAYAWPVPGETNTADNNFTDGVLKVTIPGDIDGNFKVDMGDISSLCDGFGSTIGASGNYWHKPPGILDPFIPNLDIDGNGKIDMGDIVTALGNFGQHYP